MKYVITGLALLISTVAMGDAITRTTLEKKLHADFSQARKIKVISMKENYWGLYRNYQVSFNARFMDGEYKLSCDVVAPSSNQVSVRDCTAMNREGMHVDMAKLSGGSSDRIPALAR